MFPETKFEPPLLLKIIGGVLMLLCIIHAFYHDYLVHNNYEKFYKYAISSKVAETSVEAGGRLIYYRLENGLFLSLLRPDSNQIKIGDSITKKGNSNKYKVYRKGEDSLYRLVAIVNIESDRNDP